ncbi:XRE family transcriptional regulator [Parashewanella spongiae]|uniref:XRE family transcriptional regulator n=1 Tax=Parashewanella spongiae TaxID=342950 RepID=A0A3A6UAH5_9GAMM|nr:helix-turn-helix transcriptional regulator [Parashewanella spongiae]MCL1077282.1 helix-turn-helix domain-containing protein [Parashewanella spongiae]RJY18539.1 XRE family transcriptional regulator [Parashewanella spongiae]
MSEPKQVFAENVRALRKQQNISQDKLSKLTDIDRSYIGRIDRGEVNISLDKLYEIAKALKCQPVDLLPSINYSED